MSKAHKGLTAPHAVTVLNLTDGGFQAAKLSDSFAGVVSQMRALCPALGTDGVSEEDKGAMWDGIRRAYMERKESAPMTFRKEGEDTYVSDPNGGTALTVELAMAYSTYEFGKLAPNWKALVKKVRDGVGKYVSQRYARIEAEAKRQTTEGVERQRQGASFTRWFALEGTAIRKRYDAAVKRGEPGLPDPRMIEKIIAQIDAAK